MKAKLKNVQIEKVEGKKEPKQQAMSKQEKLHRTVKKIELAQDKYEDTDEIDKWSIHFHPRNSYDVKSFDEIKAIHSKLISAEISIDKLRLLNYVERGMLYDFLKNPGRHGGWISICQSLDVCRRTAYR